MELKEWQKGLTLCRDNILDLFQEANLLMNQKRWSRGCFLFITAYEELAIAFFILGNYHTPKPEELEKYFFHPKKLAVSSFLTFPGSGNLRLLQEYFNKFIKIDFDAFDLKEEDVYDKDWYKLGNKLQKEERLSSWRKKFLYLSFSSGKLKFVSPRLISKKVKAKIALTLYNRLSITIPILQSLILKLLTSKSKEIDIKEILFKGTPLELWKPLDIIYEFYKIVNTRSIEKVRSFDKVSKKLRDLVIANILDPNTTKDDQFQIDIATEMLKDIAPKYSKIWEDEVERKKIKIFINSIRHLNPPLAKKIESSFIILNKIAKEELTPEDLHNYFKTSISKE